MSERGSFVTEYMYCDKCAAAVNAVFQAEHEIEGLKYFAPFTHPEYKTKVIAGKVGELYAGGERTVFDEELRELIEKVICHPVRIAVLCDVVRYDAILTFNPRVPKEN